MQMCMRVYRHGMDEPYMKVSCDRGDTLMKQAMGHRRVEQGSDDPAVDNAVVPLESGMRFEGCTNSSGLIRDEIQPESPGVFLPTQETFPVSMLETEPHRVSGRPALILFARLFHELLSSPESGSCPQ
jgi:hypothetical protein